MKAFGESDRTSGPARMFAKHRVMQLCAIQPSLWRVVFTARHEGHSWDSVRRLWLAAMTRVAA
jgi:hypothetical protein